MNRARSLVSLAVALLAASLLATCGDEGDGRQDGGSGSWVVRAPLSAGALQETPAVELGGRIYVLGGFDGDGASVTTVEAYSPSTDSWRRVADLPVPMNHANAAAAGGRLHVVGFLDAGFGGVGRVLAFDPADGRWTERTAMPAGTGRGASGTAEVDGLIYVLGGSRGGQSVADASVYDPASDRWTELPPMPGGARDHLAAAAVDGLVYAIGGRRNGAITARLEVFDPRTGAWSARAAMPTARGGLAAAALGGKLYVFGGEGNPADPLGVFDQTEAYDPAADRWETLAPMATPRHGIGAAALGDRIYVPGGATREGFGAVATHEAFVPAAARVPSLALPGRR